MQKSCSLRVGGTNAQEGHCGKGSWRKIFPNKICGSICCGDPLWLRKQTQVPIRHILTTGNNICCGITTWFEQLRVEQEKFCLCWNSLWRAVYGTAACSFISRLLLITKQICFNCFFLMLSVQTSPIMHEWSENKSSFLYMVLTNKHFPKPTTRTPLFIFIC